MTAIAFTLAAAFGALVRWQTGRLNGPHLPLGTFAVNLAAAFAAGLASDVSTTLSLILVTAFLGSMSTFSTVMGEVVDLRETAGVLHAGAYVTVTVVAGVAAAWTGLAIA